MKYTLYKIKEGKRAKWITWCSELQTDRHEEAIETLIEENLHFEECILFEKGTDTYALFAWQEGVGGKNPTNMSRELNLKHRRLLEECLEPVGRFRGGYTLSTRHE